MTPLIATLWLYNHFEEVEFQHFVFIIIKNQFWNWLSHSWGLFIKVFRLRYFRFKIVPSTSMASSFFLFCFLHSLLSFPVQEDTWARIKIGLRAGIAKMTGHLAFLQHRKRRAYFQWHYFLNRLEKVIGTYHWKYLSSNFYDLKIFTLW